MVTRRLMMRAVAGLGLWAGVGATAQAQLPTITAEDALRVQPKQKGVNVSTPPAADAPRCTVAPIPNPKDAKTPMGYVVRDPAGKPVRQFVSYDNKTFNIIAFYVDGAEAYREVTPPQSTEAAQFRWLGPNGTKWGLDKNRDGAIDEWVVLSPEELSQELLQAILTRDAKRAEALALTKANLDSIGYQGPEAQKLLDRAAGAAARVAKAADELKASPEAKWLHVQLNAPQAIPSDALGARDDLVFHKTGTVFVQEGNNATKSFQTGEFVLVGRAWKLVDGPSVGATAADAGPGAQLVIDSIKDLVAKLDEIDRQPPAPTLEGIAAHNAKRAAVLEQIHTKLEADKSEQAVRIRETWTKLLLDSVAAAAEVEKMDGRHVARLKQFKDTFAGKPTPIGPYAWFRYIQVEHSVGLREPKTENLPAVQEKWRAALEEFLKANPKAEDAPEAALRLGMAYEFLASKEGDAKAKEWYAALAKDYAGHPHAAKAAGAVKRLDSEGKPLEVAGPALADGKPFSTASIKDKAVVVYYCASWSSTLAADAKALKALTKEYGAKLEVVIVNLDADAKAAQQTVAAHGLAALGTVLHAPGGLDASPLATQYGIVVVPHIFVAGKDGKVVNRNAQAVGLEEDVKKLLP